MLISTLTNYERMDSKNVRYNTGNFNMEEFRAWLKDLCDPQDMSELVFHVVGTKGKGSTGAMLAAALQGCGLRTGLFTSPHISKVTERIRIDGREIDAAMFCDLSAKLVNSLRHRLERSGEQIVGMRTAFELLTAMAFCHFRSKKCKAAVVEAGLGGRLDASNVFRNKKQCLVNIIMPVGLEHQTVLGRTLKEIAAEKAAVIQKHSSFVVLGFQDKRNYETVLFAIRERMKVVGTTAKLIDLNTMPKPVSLGGRRWCIVSGNSTSLDVKCPLEGAHQAHNMMTALIALKAVSGFDMDTAATAVAAMPIWHGRFEILKKKQYPVVIDGAHCRLSVGAMIDTWKQLFGDVAPIVVCGFMADKAVKQILTIVADALRPTQWNFCASSSPRALQPVAIAKIFSEKYSDQKYYYYDSLQAALNKGFDSRKPVLVFGSLMLMDPARSAWEKWKAKHDKG